jgi:phosphoglucomutase
MSISPLAGKPVPPELLIDVAALERAYEERQPDLADPNQLVSFGTSGHRGTALEGTFTQAHVAAITQAIVENRAAEGITGPIILGKDTHALSGPAQRTALEVLAGNGVEVWIQADDGFTPTPVVSHAILTFNRGRRTGLADAIVITPSHNPPADGGFKYNPPNGGPADTDVTDVVQKRANLLMGSAKSEIRRVPYSAAVKASTTRQVDLRTPYLRDLGEVVDLDAIRAAGISIGVDPMGGAAAAYWEPLAEMYGLNLTVVNPKVDPTFSFMMVDHDGKVRMDCSSPWAMAGLVHLKDRFRVAFGNDPDADRHGIVTPSAGLLNPNHYLAVAIRYLLSHRPGWKADVAIGKTLVSSSLIDRVVGELGRRLVEVPVGFKWFAPGLYEGTLGFGGEESAGASFLRRDGSVWTTDKDGPILGLLAAEITAVTGRDPGEHYQDVIAKHGAPSYTRIDAPATPEQKRKLKALSPVAVTAAELAGEPITGKLIAAPGNGASLGGLKVTTANGWFAARPSGTENVYKLYAESFRGDDHLKRIVEEAQAIVSKALV